MQRMEAVEARANANFAAAKEVEVRLSLPGGHQIGYMDHTGCRHQFNWCFDRWVVTPTPGGVRLVTWTVPAVVINWCFDCKITW
jgi:hypothetical protein